MKEQMRVIKTRRGYSDALARLSTLMDKEFKPGSNQEAELELLALLIESYERSKVAPVSPDPIAAILFRMDQQKLGKKDLVPYIGSISKVSEVLSRKRPLSLSMIRKLNAGLHIPAETLIAGAADADVDVDFSAEPRFNYARFPLPEMLERGHFPDFKGGIKHVKKYAEDLMCKFMRGALGDGACPALLRARLHQSGSRVMDEYALLVWRICVLKKARNLKLVTKYREGAITVDWPRDLVKLSRFEAGPHLGQEFLADNGIVLVIEQHFRKTYLDGAAVLDDGIPIVALTLRHESPGQFLVRPDA